MKTRLSIFICFVLLTIAGCTVQETGLPIQEDRPQGVTGIVPDFIDVDESATKTTVSISNAFSWAEGDVIGVFAADGETQQTNFTINTLGTDASSASFNGGAWAIRSGGYYGAYYPYRSIITNSDGSVDFSLEGQVQDGNNSPAHLGAFDLMYAYPAVATSDGTVAFSFQHQVAIFKPKITVPADGTYVSITYTADRDCFAPSGMMYLEDGSIDANYSNTMRLDLDNVTLNAGDVLIGWFFVIPTASMTGAGITVSLTDSEGNITNFVYRGGTYEPGKVYAKTLATPTSDYCQLPSGSTFNAAVVTAAGGDACNVTKISFKTGQVVTNTTDGYDITFDSATGEVTVSTSAEEFKLPADASYMFDGFQNMTEMEGMDKINTTDVTNMAYMFNVCMNLASLDVSGFETSNVTDMQCMFDACKSLTALDLSSFDTELVTTMYAMFDNCQELADLNISSFRTPSVETFNQMFNNCYAIERLDLSMWDVSHAYAFVRMFKNCNKLSWLNIEGWDLSLANLYTADNHEDIFSGIAASTIGIDIASQKPTPLNLYCDEPALVTIVDWLRECGCDMIDWLSPRPTEIPVLPDGSDFNTIISTKAGGYDIVGSIEFSAVNDVYDLRGENILGTYPGIYVYVEDYGGTTKNVYVSTLAPKMEANTDCSGMFCNFGEVRTITGWGVVNTSNVVYANSMFADCEKLTYSDIQYMSTESMAAMLYMFAHCNQFDFGDKLKYFSTSNATDMEGMFQGCEALTDLDLLSFNTSNVTCMDYMFENCDNLQRIVFGDYFTIEDGCSVNDIINGLGGILEEGSKTMFVCSNSLWNRLTADAVETGYDSSMHFREADYALLPKDFIDHSYSTNSTRPIKKITFITGSSYNEGTLVTTTEGAPVYVEYEYAGMNQTTWTAEYEYRVYTSAKEFRLPADASDFFDLSQMSALKEIEGLEYLNTSAVTNMSGMFRYAKIPYLDLHSFDVSHVTNMSEMFNNTDIKIINLDGFNTASLTNMSNMFYASTKLEKIDMPTFDLTHVANCSGAFGKCWNLYSVKLGTKFIIGNGCSTGNMFEELGDDVDAIAHSGYNTTFYCTQNIFDGFDDLLPQITGCSYHYVGSADVGFNGGDNDGGRMTD